MLFVMMIIAMMLLPGCAVVKHRDELGVLMSMSKEEGQKQDVLDQETKAFEKCKKTLLEDGFEIGMPAKKILERIGEPVITNRLEDGIRWSYKAGNTTWFKGEVIHLIFNRNNELAYWKCDRLECPAVPAS